MSQNFGFLKFHFGGRIIILPRVADFTFTFWVLYFIILKFSSPPPSLRVKQQTTAEETVFVCDKWLICVSEKNEKKEIVKLKQVQDLITLYLDSFYFSHFSIAKRRSCSGTKLSMWYFQNLFPPFSKPVEFPISPPSQVLKGGVKLRSEVCKVESFHQYLHKDPERKHW